MAYPNGQNQTPPRCYCMMKTLLGVIYDNPEYHRKLYYKQVSGSIKKGKRILAHIKSDITKQCTIADNQHELLRIKYETALPTCLQEKLFKLDNLFITDKILDSSIHNVIVFGTLNRGTHIIEVAVKMKLWEFDVVETEVSAMRALTHPNVMPVIGLNLEHGIILTEYMRNGTLQNVCTTMQSTNQLFKYIYDVINGLKYIHGKKFIHRDLEISNVFVDDNYRCRIGDLENAVYLGNSLVYIQKGKFVQSYHCPKEAFEYQVFSYASDIYSLAYLMMEVLLSPNVKESAKKSYLMSELEKVSKSERCPGNIFQIVMKALSPNPQNRPTIVDFYNVVESLLNF
ncbi:proto-oncogene tyrosine-protein kinase LCK-like [Aethina tumida]|uniref:proto-oncogene tyrosine-protein kinase LCK-like n=1 Tax=Aethina tumida TaxID=116153 RepID=UPI00214807FF|nr:proto-oncogene tyrosine-protein kinase LCK-like [Aethina tumida]